MTRDDKEGLERHQRALLRTILRKQMNPSFFGPGAVEIMSETDPKTNHTNEYKQQLAETDQDFVDWLAKVKTYHKALKLGRT